MKLEKPKRRVSFDISGGGLPEGFKQRINAVIDYSTASEDQVMDWADSNRVIAIQRPLRTMQVSALKELGKEEMVVLAQDAGRKVQTPEEIKQMGMVAFDKMTHEEQLAYIKECELKAAGHKVPEKK